MQVVRVRVYPESRPAATLLASPATALGLFEGDPLVATRIRTWRTVEPDCRITLTLYAADEEGPPNSHLPEVRGPVVLVAHGEPVGGRNTTALHIDDVLEDGTADAVLSAFGRYVRKVCELGGEDGDMEQARPYQEALTRIRLDIKPQALLGLGT